MTAYDDLTLLVQRLNIFERAQCIDAWYSAHEDEPWGAHDGVLTVDLMCRCCGVDYSGFDRDLLNDDGSAPPDFEFRRKGWGMTATRMSGGD